MNHQIEKLQTTLAPLRQQIINHKIYSIIDDIESLQIFMQYHVYAVWDFMSLLKTLQQQLTCTSVPWFPKGSADNRFLINEIVVGEESDVDVHGVRKSHFEMYLDAMKQSGADTIAIHQFIETLQQTNSRSEAYTTANSTEAVQKFVNFTFDIIDSNKPYLQAAIFTFGREDLIPGMFISMISDIHKNFPESIGYFKYYLERHIEVDGNHHSNLALQMTANLCGDNQQYWEEATQASVASLQKRIELWDAVYKHIWLQKQLLIHA